MGDGHGPRALDVGDAFEVRNMWFDYVFAGIAAVMFVACLYEIATMDREEEKK